MKPELRIRLFNQLLFNSHKLRHPLIHRTAVGLYRQLQVILVMPRFGLQQAVVELRQLLIQVRCQGCEALSGAGLDDGTDNQHIHQAARIVLAHGFAQAGGVAGRRQVGVGHTPLVHDRQHLLEVP